LASVDGDVSALRAFADLPLTDTASIVIRVAADYFSDPSQFHLSFSGSEERIDDGTEVKGLANNRKSPLVVHGLKFRKMSADGGDEYKESADKGRESDDEGKESVTDAGGTPGNDSGSEDDHSKGTPMKGKPAAENVRIAFDRLSGPSETGARNQKHKHQLNVVRQISEWALDLSKFELACVLVENPRISVQHRVDRATGEEIAVKACSVLEPDSEKESSSGRLRRLPSLCRRASFRSSAMPCRFLRRVCGSRPTSCGAAR
jgi:hypothetical protein